MTVVELVRRERALYNNTYNVCSVQYSFTREFQHIENKLSLYYILTRETDCCILLRYVRYPLLFLYSKLKIRP